MKVEDSLKNGDEKHNLREDLVNPMTESLWSVVEDPQVIQDIRTATQHLESWREIEGHDNCKYFEL